MMLKMYFYDRRHILPRFFPWTSWKTGPQKRSLIGWVYSTGVHCSFSSIFFGMWTYNCSFSCVMGWKLMTSFVFQAKVWIIDYSLLHVNLTKPALTYVWPKWLQTRWKLGQSNCLLNPNWPDWNQIHHEFTAWHKPIKMIRLLGLAAHWSTGLL